MTGNLGNAVIMMGSLAVATRALGPEDFGLLAIALAVGRVCERIVRFESWQPLVRFIANEEGADDPERLSRLYLFGLLLDVIGALAAAVLSCVVALVLSRVFGFASELPLLVAIYAFAIALNLRGMSSAVLRMAGKFRTMAYIVFIAGLLRLALALGFYLAGYGLLTFVVIWTVSQIVDAVIFNLIAFRHLSRQGVPSPLRARRDGLMRDYPGFLGFAFTTNASSALRTITHEADTLMVAAMAGSASAGFYHLAKRMAKVAMQSGDLIQMVIYPDLARMWATQGGPSFRKTVSGVQIVLALLVAAIMVVAVPFGKPLIALVFGDGFTSAYPILIAHLVAVFLILHSAPARSGLLAMNRPHFVLGTAAVSTALFLGIAFYAIPTQGAIGASFAHIGFGLLTALLLDIALWRTVKHDTGNHGSVSSA